MEFNTGNISTIATWLAISLTAVLTYFGYTVDQTQLIATISAVITLIIAVWSSKNPNNLEILGNAEVNTSESTVLNDEYTGDIDDGS